MFLKTLKLCFVILLPIVFVFSLTVVLSTCGGHDAKHFDNQNTPFYQVSSFCLGQKVILSHNIEHIFLDNKELIQEDQLRFQDLEFTEDVVAIKPWEDVSFLALSEFLINPQILKQISVVKIE